MMLIDRPSRVRDNGAMTSDAARLGTDADGLTVGRAAELVGVSVRTLHHWDSIGLVRPSDRTWAGYRVYSGRDVARIHRVLVYRELGFPLAEIARILDEPGVDATRQLKRQREQLVAQIDRLRSMVGSVDELLSAAASGIQLTAEQQVAIFGDDWRPEWVDGAEARWGESAAWAQYSERAARLSPSDWERVSARTRQLDADLIAARQAGVEPGSDEADALAERHRELMSTYFDCTHAMQVCMGRMFVEDAGFAAHYDAMTDGLAVWLREVLFANARAHGVDPATAVWE